MFFTLAPAPDIRLPNHDKFGNYWFSHDDGWEKIDNYWYKGYNYPQINHGNFLKLELVSDHDVLLKHDVVRGFPLWWNNQTQILTNLLGTGLEIFNDKIVQIQNYWLREKHCSNYVSTALKELSVDTAVDLVCDNLVAKAQALASWNVNIPKRMFLTGGIDTATIYSVLQYVGIDVDLVDYEYIKYDWFLNKNFDTIKTKHWGFKQTHHWDYPVLLATGSYGDEYLMRGPTTTSMWAAFNDINILELLTTKQDSYHHDYFLKDKNTIIFKNCWNSRLAIRKKFKAANDLNNQIINICSNDHQHWHLGNTMVWTPFKDIELLKISLSMNKKDLTDQILDATLNKTIIKKMYPKALSMISRQKNINSREHLNNL